MMKLKIKDVIKLNDGNEYAVVSNAYFEKETYVYIVDINDNSKFKIVKFVKNKLAEVPDDQELIRKLIVLFYENAVKEIDFNELVRGQPKRPKNG